MADCLEPSAAFCVDFNTWWQELGRKYPIKLEIIDNEIIHVRNIEAIPASSNDERIILAALATVADQTKVTLGINPPNRHRYRGYEFEYGMGDMMYRFPNY